MAFPDSMFLLEVVVEKLTSFVKCKAFLVKGQFADVFSLELRDPNEVAVKMPRKKKMKRKTVRVIKDPPKHEEPMLQCGQSILLAHNADKLRSRMVNFPIELSLWSSHSPQNKLGSAEIPWSQKYLDYLNKVNVTKTPQPVAILGNYNVFDEVTSKRMAIISLKIKLSHLKNCINQPISSILDNNFEKFISTMLKPETTEILNTYSNKQKTYEKFDTGIVKAKYVSDGRKKDRKVNPSKNKTKKQAKSVTFQKEMMLSESIKIKEIKAPANKILLRRISTSLVDIPKSEPQYEKVLDIDITKSKSCTSIKHAKKLNPMRYIFGDVNQRYANKVYYVGYFTVQNDTSPSGEASEATEKSEESKPRLKVKICDSECPAKRSAPETDSISHLSIDVPIEGTTISVKKCDAVDCGMKDYRVPQPKPDERILIGVNRPRLTEKVEEVVGGMDAKLKLCGKDPCFCTCECTFGFTKKTTYCEVCGGYEIVGEEIVGNDGQLPFPCPIFHKLVDKNKSKTLMSTSGSDSRRTMKGSKAEPEKPHKKGKNRRTDDDRFKFNYGYEGIPPHIGHSHCAMPCAGTLGAVPKHMGWLWTAENIPGMKFRPLWRPGAANKHVVRLLRMARNPGDVLTKKRRRETKPKKPLQRPLLIVHKKDGEYTVTMETMRTYNKPRTVNQYPYEDKPVITYTIGRTEQENILRQRKKERDQRRLERLQRQFIQSAFRDMCNEICLKTYQQALGILPPNDTTDCPCSPANPDPEHDGSRSCSLDSSTDGTGTDSDEWIVEFTPPNAKFDPKFKTKKIIKVDNCSQYNYLDYRVKLLDRYGNPVPRFFKGQDGKQLCSDLGGFWSPDHKWLDINVDGYIGPDGRWAPNTFFGPGGELVDAEVGKFQLSNGNWYVVGVDGYVDAQNKWRPYPKPRQMPQPKKRPAKGKGGGGDKIAKPVSTKPSEGTFSCFGDVSPKLLSEMGIIGHGPDKKSLLAALKELIARGEDVKIPEPSFVPRLQSSKKGRKTPMRVANVYDARSLKCRHPTPSSKGVLAVNPRGDKIYFRLKDAKNPRPKQRLAKLDEQGISLSSFHAPCFHSFINSEMMKRRRLDGAISHDKAVDTRAGAHWANVQV